MGFPRSYMIPRQRLKRQRIEALAEALAEGAPSVNAACQQIGITQSVGQRYWQEICGGLGRQAQ